jgi:hypothetical protein
VDAALNADFATKQAISYVISSTASDLTNIPPVTVYWNCLLSAAGMSRDLSAVIAQTSGLISGAQTSVNNSEITGEVSGTFVVSAPTSDAKKITITNLRSNSSYSCRFWAINQGGNNASNATTFTTAPNGGKLYKVRFNFDASKYNAASNQKLLCWLAQSFAVTAGAIRSVYNEYCGSSAPALPLPYNKTMNQSDVNLTVVQVPLYFLPNLKAEQDAFYLQVQGAVADPSWVSALKAAGLGITGIGASNISIPTIPSMNGALANNATAGATLSGYSLNASGYVYAVLTSNDTLVPTIFDLMKGKGPNGGAALAAQVDYNDDGSLTQGSLTFSNLTATSYNLYWIATCDDPSENAMACATPIQSAVISPLTDNPNAGAPTTNAKAISFGLGLISLIMMIILG